MRYNDPPENTQAHEKLRNLIAKRRMTQAEMAKKCGIASCNFNQILRGRTTPGPVTRRRIADGTAGRFQVTERDWFTDLDGKAIRS